MATSKLRKNWPQLHWLETFITVVDNDGVEAKAAVVLGISPSSVNRYVGDLQTWARSPLFIDARANELSPFGDRLAATARHVLQQLDGIRAHPRADALTAAPRISPKDLKV